MLIGLCGLKNSGKSTISKFLVQHYNFNEFAFADSLKRACIEIFGLTNEQVFGSFQDKETIDDYWNVSPRVIMQTLGTLVRNLSKIIPNLNHVWIRKIHKKIIELPKNTNIVISDVRYNDEAEMIKKLGGIVIKIERKKINDQKDCHESENQQIISDFIIYNNSSIENLYLQIKKIIMLDCVP